MLLQFEERNARPIRVLIADPYALFRQALKKCLDILPEIEVVAEVGSPAEYRKAMGELDYDVAVVASDLIYGTFSTAPLRADDYHLNQAEAVTGRGSGKPVVVLVTDEDLNTVPVAYPSIEKSAALWVPWVPRSAPTETLVEVVLAAYTTRRKDQVGR